MLVQRDEDVDKPEEVPAKLKAAKSEAAGKVHCHALCFINSACVSAVQRCCEICAVSSFNLWCCAAAGLRLLCVSVCGTGWQASPSHIQS